MSTENLINEPSSSWGGIWTRKKIEILVEYASAYLSIMKERTYWKLLYFDGFAGSRGDLENTISPLLAAAIPFSLT